MKHMSRKTWLLAGTALLLALFLQVGGAMAYFTAYSQTQGGVKINLGFTTTIPHEKVDEKGKHVTIENSGDYDCFVRVKAFATADQKLTYNPDSHWKLGDGGYYYYQGVLKAKETTKGDLNITYTFPAGEEKPDAFNIVVVQEYSPVVYDAEGNPVPDWKQGYTKE